VASDTAQSAGKKFVLSIVLTGCAFAIWGFAQWLYAMLISPFAAALSLNASQAHLAQWVLCLGYCLAAIPAAMLTRHFGYKSGVVFGFGCFGVGMFLFYPAAEQHQFYYFLGAALVAGTGLSFLEISANPMIARLGPVESSVRRLNIAQIIIPIGGLAGFLVGGWIIQSFLQHQVTELARALVQPYFAIGVVMLFFAFVVDIVEFPPIAGERVMKGERISQDFARLFSRPLFILGLGAMCLCLVAQVVLLGLAVPYRLGVIPGLPLTSAGDIVLWSLIACIIGRFVGTAAMYWIDPARLMAVFAGSAAVLTAAVTLVGGQLGVLCIVGASFFMSILFPTIFGSSIRDLGPLTKSGSALLILAAGVGAAGMAIPNLEIVMANIRYMMLIPSLCFAVIMVFAVALRKTAARIGAA
jgi:MFS transporter, FHS family, L-fucose permease